MFNNKLLGKKLLVVIMFIGIIVGSILPVYSSDNNINLQTPLNTRDVTARVRWNGSSVVNPPVKIQLFKNGTVDTEPIIVKANETSHTWEKLPTHDPEGKRYQYHVEHVESPKGYDASYGKNDLEIVYTYIEPEVSSIRKERSDHHTPEVLGVTKKEKVIRENHRGTRVIIFGGSVILVTLYILTRPQDSKK